MFSKVIFADEFITVYGRYDGSLEIATITEGGFRQTKVYYGYGLDDAIKSFYAEYGKVFAV